MPRRRRVIFTIISIGLLANFVTNSSTIPLFDAIPPFLAMLICRCASAWHFSIARWMPRRLRDMSAALLHLRRRGDRQKGRHAAAGCSPRPPRLPYRHCLVDIADSRRNVKRLMSESTILRASHAILAVKISRSRASSPAAAITRWHASHLATCFSAIGAARDRAARARAHDMRYVTRCCFSR